MHGSSREPSMLVLLAQVRSDAAGHRVIDATNRRIGHGTFLFDF
jgi:hypothetical protein